MRIRWISLVVVAACGGKAPAPAAPPPAAPAPAPAPAPPPAPAPAPKLTARAQLDWVISILREHHGEIAASDIQAHFSPEFLAQVPPDQVTQVFQQLAHQAPGLHVASVTGDDDKLTAKVEIASGDKFRVQLAVDPESRKIVGLLFQPDEELGPRPASLDEADKMAAQIAPHAQLVVASLDRGTCKPTHELAAKDELAIGSTLKLYVLTALADQIIAGKLHWDDQLAVKDEWKSLPSGITQNDPAGTKLTVRELAERMISISDNTATDLLLRTVGRKAVEHALVEAGHAHPALDIPFPTTRDLFVLKLASTPEEIAAYLKMSPAKRRAYLDHEALAKTPTLDHVADWKGARYIDKLEWFASGEDLCHVMGALWKRAQNPKAAPLLDVLAKNPGLPIDKKVFPYIGFKGGSEPGVENLTYLLRRDDDRWFVVEAGFNSADGGTVDEGKIAGLVLGVIDVVGKDRGAAKAKTAKTTK